MLKRDHCNNCQNKPPPRSAKFVAILEQRATSLIHTNRYKYHMNTISMIGRPDQQVADEPFQTCSHLKRLHVVFSWFFPGLASLLHGIWITCHETVFGWLPRFLHRVGVLVRSISRPLQEMQQDRAHNPIRSDAGCVHSCRL